MSEFLEWALDRIFSILFPIFHLPHQCSSNFFPPWPSAIISHALTTLFMCLVWKCLTCNIKQDNRYTNLKFLTHLQDTVLKFPTNTPPTILSYLAVWDTEPYGLWIWHGEGVIVTCILLQHQAGVPLHRIHTSQEGLLSQGSLSCSSTTSSPLQESLPPLHDWPAL